MPERTKERPSGCPKDIPTHVVGSLGLAEKLLKKGEDLRPHNAWMGVSTNQKVYPDEMVVAFAKWASSRSNHFLVVIADGMQAYNEMAFGGKFGWADVDIRMEDYVEPALARKEELRGLIEKEGLDNVSLDLWNDVVWNLRQKDDLLASHTKDLFNHQRQHNPDVETALIGIVEEKIPDVLNRARKRFGKIFVDFAAATYAEEEIHLTWLMAVLGDYPIKIGPPSELVYDKFVLDGMKGKFKFLEWKKASFGAVHLVHDSN